MLEERTNLNFDDYDYEDEVSSTDTLPVEEYPLKIHHPRPVPIKSILTVPQHKALFLDAKFGKLVLGYNETPKPGAGELLVKIEAVGLNQVDWDIQKRGLHVTTFPAVIGADTAGIVVAVGKAVSDFSVGDRVFYQGSWSNDKASYQQYSIASAATTAKIPNHMSFEAAASVPVGFTSAYLGLYNTKPYGAGYSSPLASTSSLAKESKPIVVLGGETSVGQYVLQLASLSGFSPIIATASPHHTRYLQSLGATHVVDRHLPLRKLYEKVKAISQRPINIVYDTLSTPESWEAGYELVSTTGRLVTLSSSGAARAGGKEVVHVVASPSSPHTSGVVADMYSGVTEWLEDGLIRPNRVEILPGGLESIADGLARLEGGDVGGTKLIARPQQTGSVQSENKNTGPISVYTAPSNARKAVRAELQRRDKMVRIQEPSLWKKITAH